MPKRSNERVLFHSNVFTIRGFDLTFKNGRSAKFEILEKSDSCGVVPITKTGTILMIKEYVAALDMYVIDFPGGKLEKGLSISETAQKELQEELGYKAKRLKKLATFTLSPGYVTQKSTVFIAHDLVPSKLVGDELETLEVVEYSLPQLMEMIQNGTINEARTIATLYLTRDFLAKNS